MIREIAFSIPVGTSGGSLKIKPVGGMPTGGLRKVEDIIQFGIIFLFIIATLLALAFLIWGGIQWITSGGDKAGIETARKKVTFALIGLVVTFLSFFIINALGVFLGINLL